MATMMNAADAAIITIVLAEDKAIGRTAIQKLIYFETVFDLADAYFRPHYYGPYSSEVACIIQELAALGFVEEKTETKETTGYPRKYSYKLTNDGRAFFSTVRKEYAEDYEKISALIEKCKKRSNLNPQILSWAAKVNYIGSHEEKEALEFEEIISKAEKLKWDLTQGKINRASQLLKDLGLVEEI